MLMTKAAYARHKGVSRQTVYGWIAKGELVLVGGKIDSEAVQEQTNVNDWPHRTLELTWGKASRRVKFLARAIRANDAQIRLYVDAAAKELGYDVEYKGCAITLLCDGEELHFSHNHLTDNAWLAVRYLRNNLRESAEESPDLEDSWSENGLAALAITGFEA
jgi:hypothetical protein